MAKQAVRDGDIVYYFDNLPEETKLRFHNSKLTLSGVPNNFRVINIDSAPQIVVEDEQDTVSLMV
jgi:hypothetical protein